MKIIKIISLLLISLLLSACQVNYDIDINDIYECSEKIIINGFDENIANISYNSFINILNDKSEKKYIINSFDPNNIIIENNKCNLNDLTKSKMMEDYITSFQITNRYINIVFDEEKFGYLFSYPEDEEIKSTGLVLTVNLTVPFEVTKSNATYSNGNTYTWVFDKGIEFPHMVIQYEKINKGDYISKTMLISAIFIVSVVIIFVIFIILKNKKTNKF